MARLTCLGFGSSAAETVKTRNATTATDAKHLFLMIAPASFLLHAGLKPAVAERARGSRRIWIFDDLVGGLAIFLQRHRQDQQPIAAHDLQPGDRTGTAVVEARGKRRRHHPLLIERENDVARHQPRVVASA